MRASISSHICFKRNQMKYFLILMLVMDSFLLIAQSNIPCIDCKKCESCKKNKAVYHSQHLAQYTQSKEIQELIARNWGQSFFDDLDKYMKPRSANASSISVKFDAFGCIYPSFMNPSWEIHFKINDRFKARYFDNQTFYSISHRNNKTQEKTGEFLSSFPEKYQDRLKPIIGERNFKALLDNEEIAKSDFDYIDTWNNIFLAEEVEKIKSTLFSGKFERLVILIHGFAVPYSLAQIQYNNLIDFYSNQLNDTASFQKILFLKIFWPSGDYKKITSKNRQFDFKNARKLRIVGDFAYVNGRTFNVGLQLRKLISTIDFQGTTDIIGHSSGSVLATVALINPIQKMNMESNPSAINKQLASHFLTSKLPNKNIRLFINAASMPGVSTFGKDMKFSEQKNYNWVIGYNSKDRVLNKMFLKHKQFLNSFFNTSLGANAYGEVEKTIRSIKNNPLNFEKNFQFIEMGKQSDKFGHDFFCYLIQDCYTNALTDFIKTK
jgi:hypothetical protein